MFNSKNTQIKTNMWEPGHIRHIRIVIVLTTQVTFSSRKQMQYYSNLIFNFRAKPSAAKSRLIAIFQSEFFLWFAIVRWSAVGDWFDIELHRIFRSKPLSGIWLNCLVFISIRGVGARLQQPRLNTLWQNASFGNEDVSLQTRSYFFVDPWMQGTVIALLI